MIIVMKRRASDRDVEHVGALIREMGLSEHVSVGTDRAIIGAVGDRRHLDMTALESIPGVDRLVPILAPYKLASREVKTEPSVIPLGNGVVIGGPEVCVIAGPCSVEHEKQLMTTALAVREAGAVALRGGAFKPRTNPYDFQGLGEAGLKLLAKARAETGLAVVTEVFKRGRGEPGGRVCRRAADWHPQHAQLQPAGGGGLAPQADPAEAGLERDAERVPPGRRVHPERGQREGDPLRAGDSHVRRLRPQHAAAGDRPGGQARVAPADRGRSIAGYGPRHPGAGHG